MMKKLIFLCLLSCMMTVFVSSCSKDDEPSSDKPTTSNPNKPVSDPENTVTLNLLSGQKWSDATEIGNYISIYIDNAYNICGHGAQIIDVGPVAGLGNITAAPNSSWKPETAAIVGHGYMIKSDKVQGGVARLYIVSEMVSVGSAVMGYTVKYQCPMDNSFTLETDRCHIKKSGGEQKIKIYSGKGIKLKSKSDWIDVTITDEYVIVSAPPMEEEDYREGKIELYNPVNSQTITVSQYIW